MVGTLIFAAPRARHRLPQPRLNTAECVQSRLRAFPDPLVTRNVAARVAESHKEGVPISSLVPGFGGSSLYIVRAMARISSKHQVTLPVESLEATGLRAGDEVMIEAEGEHRIVVHRASPNLASALGRARLSVARSVLDTDVLMGPAGLSLSKALR